MPVHWVPCGAFLPLGYMVPYFRLPVSCLWKSTALPVIPVIQFLSLCSQSLVYSQVVFLTLQDILEDRKIVSW